jgi:hypothetical protein
MAADEPDEARLPRPARWEIVGAWLHIWTPPRGTYVPPVPMWRLLAATLVTAVAITVAVIVIGGWKENGEEQERRAAAAAEARHLDKLARDQSPRRATVSVRAAAGTSPDELRAAVVGQLEEAITADAQARSDAGTLTSRAERTDCRPYYRPWRADPPDPPIDARRAGYECTAVSSDIKANSSTRAGRLGYPFWARVDFTTGKVVWCKINPRGAERGIGGDRYVALDPDCDLDGRAS